MATATMAGAVTGEWIGIDEVRHRTGWGSSRTMRLSLLGQLRYRVLPSGRLAFCLEDVERVASESK